MSKNIEIQINTGSNTYEVLYPKTLGSLVSGAVSSATSANTATSATTANKLSTARSLQVSLGSTSSQAFDGSGNAVSIGVTGILSLANGGTGVNNYSSLADKLNPYISVGEVGKLKMYNVQYSGTGTYTSARKIYVGFNRLLFLMLGQVNGSVLPESIKRRPYNSSSTLDMPQLNNSSSIMASFPNFKDTFSQGMPEINFVTGKTNSPDCFLNFTLSNGYLTLSYLTYDGTMEINEIPFNATGYTYSVLAIGN